MELKHASSLVLVWHQNVDLLQFDHDYVLAEKVLLEYQRHGE